jgi:hypothetical protein
MEIMKHIVILSTMLLSALAAPQAGAAPGKQPNIVLILADLAEHYRTTLGDHTGPGKEARFFEPGEHWPAVITSTDSPEKTPTAIPKAKHDP